MRQKTAGHSQQCTQQQRFRHLPVRSFHGNSPISLQQRTFLCLPAAIIAQKSPDSIKSRDLYSVNMPNYSVILIQFLCRKLYHLLSAMRIRFTAFFSLPCAISISRSPAFFLQNRFRTVCGLTGTGHVDFVGPLAGTRQHDRLFCRNIHKTARNRRYTAFAVPMMVRPPTPSAATYGTWFGRMPTSPCEVRTTIRSTSPSKTAYRP